MTGEIAACEDATRTGSIVKGGDGSLIFSLLVAADTLQDLEVSIAKQCIKLHDNLGVQTFDLPCPVEAEACQVRFQSRRRRLVVTLHPLCALADVALTPAKGSLDDVLQDGGPRGGGQSRLPLSIYTDKLPINLARDVRRILESMPSEAWQLATTRNQPRVQDAGKISMRFHRLAQQHPGAQELKDRVRAALALVLLPQRHERILVNFSRYEAGDFLDSHPDTPSGCPSYERRQAFVWHLSESWTEEDGGLFVDEEADGGPKHVVPSFNCLVTFPVPRWHAVTKVAETRKGRPARFAVYGWVVVPCLEKVSCKEEFLGLLRQTAVSAKAVALLWAQEPLNSSATLILQEFAGLPVEEVGRHTRGELCVFAISSAADVAQAMGLPRDARVAVAVHSDPGIVEREWATCPSRPLSEKMSTWQVFHDLSQLQNLSELRRLVDIARKIFSPCPELTPEDTLLMEDMFHSPEVKVFVFASVADRTPSVAARLNSWASAVQPRLRIYLAEPRKAQMVLSDFGLSLADVPTAVAYDTIGGLGRSRLKDFMSGPPRLDMEFLRQWLGCLAEAAGLSSPRLT